MRPHPILTAAIGLAAVFLAGTSCGSDMTGESADGPTTGTTTTVVAPPPIKPTAARVLHDRRHGASAMQEESVPARADALCAAYDEMVVANGPLDIDGFDPADPDPLWLPLVAEHFAPVLDAGDELRDQLASLTGGSDDEQALLVDLVEALAAENANARTQADAARRSDVEAFTATLPSVDTLSSERIDAANALGASHCAMT